LKLSAKIPAAVARKYRDKKNHAFFIACFYVGSLETFGVAGTAVITWEIFWQAAKQVWKNLPQIVAVIQQQAAEKARVRRGGNKSESDVPGVR
jgi:hypothetical protein